MSRYQDIYSLVKRIPPGCVTSYGRIARIINCGAREVGYAMAATPSDQGIPWHRVVNSKGEISFRKDGRRDTRQRQLLTNEGIVFDEKGRINLDRFGWFEGELFDWPDQAEDEQP